MSKTQGTVKFKSSAFTREFAQIYFLFAENFVSFNVYRDHENKL